MSIKIGMNGFGRMGRLTMRALYDQADVQIVQINDPAQHPIVTAASCITNCLARVV